MIAAAPRPTGPIVAIGPAPEAAAWDGLFSGGLAPHPHYARHVVAAHGRAGLLPEDLRFVTVRRGGRLAALMPFVLRRDVSSLGGRVARPWLSPFVTATAPLVAAGADPEAVLDALAAGLETASGGRAWRWPLLPTGEGAVPGLLAAMRARGWVLGEVAAFDRPVLERRANLDAYLAGHPNRGRFKDLRRRARRLSEAGTVALAGATDGPALAALVEAFLGLERAGWKGEAGTAMACRPQTAALARALFTGSAGPVGVRADALTLDGTPIAISLALVGGGTATLLKTAYDESLRTHAPGLLLEEAILRACHETAFADRLDSATLAGSALENLYRERTRVAEIVALPPRARGAISLDRRLRLARFEHEARTAAKRVLNKG